MMTERIIERINGILEAKERAVVAIDGRCASGKTTLSRELAKRLDCNVLHMDDFFLTPLQRTPERLAEAGENVDHERFLSEVLENVIMGKEFSYRPFNCRKGCFDEPIFVPKKPIYIVEGAYCCNKALWEHYDLRVFMTVLPDEQMRRIVKRDGKEYSKVFEAKWIPLEEKYFKEYDIENRCDLVVNG